MKTINQIGIATIILSFFSVLNCNAQFNSILSQDSKKSVCLFIDKEENKTKEVVFVRDTIISNSQDLVNTSPSKSLQLNMPLKNLHITSNFGMRFHPIDKVHKFHRGTDFKANRDTVFAVYGGEILDSGYSNSLGYYVKVHFKGFTAIYGHLSKYFVRKGDYVKSGTKLGLTGSTGKSTGEHLHLTIKTPTGYINPKTLLEKINNN